MGVIERYLYRNANKIVPNMPGAVEHIAHMGIDRGKVEWISNGVDPSFLTAPVPPSQNEHFTLMYAGKLGTANCLDTVLDAAAIIQKKENAPPIKIRLIGGGPEKLRLKQRVEHENLHSVTVEDSVPKTEIYGVLLQADGFLMNLKDSAVFQYGVSPNKLYDYMASCRPVIYSMKAATNPVKDAQAGLTVEPDNPEALANAMLELASTPATERWEMGLRGRHYIEENHDFAKLAVRLEQVLLEAVNGQF